MLPPSPSSTSGSVQRTIDDGVGTDRRRLKVCLHEQKKHAERLQRELHALVNGGNASDNNLRSTLEHAEQACNKCDTLAFNTKALSLRVSQCLADASFDVETIRENVENTLSLKHLHRYLEWVQMLQTLSSDVTMLLKAPSMSREVHAVYQKMTKICSQLKGSHCVKLWRYALQLQSSLHDVLERRITADFEKSLKDIGWPTHMATTQTIKGSDAAFLSLVRQLIEFQFPLAGTNSSINDDCGIDIGEEERLLVIQLMAKPLSSRFRFHFYGKKKTNQVDKPEWWCTYALNLVRDLTPMLTRLVQPILDDMHIWQYDIKVELIAAIMVLVSGKVFEQLPVVVEDAALLKHLVGEVLAMEQQLRSQYDYPVHMPRAIVAVTRVPAYVDRWLHVEYLFSQEQLDKLLMSPSAWLLKFSPDVDALKIPHAADELMALLKTITERASLVTNIDIRIRFLNDVQLILLDEFQQEVVLAVERNFWRVASLSRLERMCPLVNAAAYVAAVLDSWGEELYFVDLQHALSARNENLEKTVGATVGSVFDKMKTRYNTLVSGLLDTIVESLRIVFIDQSHEYRHQMWHGAERPDHLDISPYLCDPLTTLREWLSVLRGVLADSLYMRIWPDIATAVNDIFFNNIILEGEFDAVGSAQLHHDTTVLFSLFKHATSKPENFLKRTKEAVVLLNMSIDQISVLTQALLSMKTNDNSSEKEVRELLESSSIYRLNVYEVAHVLSTNRLLNKKNRSDLLQRYKK